MVASRRPEALPDGLAAELVCLAWEEDGELLVRPGLLHLQRPLPVSRASISSLGPGPEGRAEAAPLCLLGFSCPPTARLSGRSQWKPLSHGTRPPPPQVLGTGRVGGRPGHSRQGARPPGASQTHLESLREVQGAAELTCSRCYFFRGSAGGAVLPALHVSPAGCAACPGICPNKQDGQVLPNSVEAGEAGCGQPGTQ